WSGVALSFCRRHFKKLRYPMGGVTDKLFSQFFKNLSSSDSSAPGVSRYDSLVPKFYLLSF
ncbi:hypothetical protein, partial [Pseudomonas avellanae]|uniref:hypothetical protein n=1 Tax=Pseudomonas avellanae TaxID=46257 RepID=UPI001ED9B54D